MRILRTNRVVFFIVTLFACASLITLSLIGVLNPVEGAAATPVNFLSGIFNRIGITITNVVEDVAEVQSLADRNAELEVQLIRQQAELIELREIAADYDRIAGILDYTRVNEEQEVLVADVIGVDQSTFVRSIIINRGTRDGVEIGMPVVTQLGLVGRVIGITANASKIQLITDESSAVSARLQQPSIESNRIEGSVIGLLTGNLRMTFIPFGEEIFEGDLAITSGLGGNFPPNLVIGQVTSVRQFEAELFQEAEIRSFIDFDSLETLLVITSFRPIDTTIFDEEPTG